MFRLQSDEWRQTSEMLRRTLEDAQRPPLDRLRCLVHAFVLSECAEAHMRTALNDAAPLYRDAPETQETQEARAAGRRTFELFMQELLPDAPLAARALAADLVMRSLSTLGKSFSESPRDAAEIEAWSEAMADMLCAYLTSLGAGRFAGPQASG